MQKDLQSNQADFVYLRNLLEFDDGYDEDIWHLIAGKIQRDKYNFRGLLRFPLFEQIRLVENFVNEVKSAYRNFEHEYSFFCQNCQGYNAPTFYGYVCAHLSERSFEKRKSKQRLNPSAKTNISCHSV